MCINVILNSNIIDCLLKIGSVYYVISLGIQDHKTRKCYIQFHSIVALVLNKIYKQNPQAVYFLAVRIVHKQEEMSIYF